MKPFRRVSGKARLLDRDNVDTDLIISAEHMKTVSRTGLGRHAFEALQREPGNPFDEPGSIGSPILIVGENFGCGSSREHAAWALADLGIRAIVAVSFADIFAANAYRNGIVTVALARPLVRELMDRADREPVTIDLEQMTVSANDLRLPFELDAFRRHCLMNGLDEIALTLASEPAIRAFEERLRDDPLSRPGGST